MRRRAVAAIVGVASIAGTVGCTAAGYPRFVQFSPDGRRLVYEDARYDRVYVYDLGAGKKHVLVAGVACMDRNVKCLVLQPHRAAGGYTSQEPIAYTLASITESPPTLTPLPALDTGLKWPQVFFEFEPDGRAMVATCYEQPAKAPKCCRRQVLGDKQWTDVEIPGDRREMPPWRLFSPGGVRDGGYCYHPVYEPGVVPEQHTYGIGVASEFRTDGSGWITHVLRGPDGMYIVRVNDADDPWHRMTLTRVSTMKKEVILDKNDAAMDIVDIGARMLLIPAYPFLPRI